MNFTMIWFSLITQLLHIFVKSQQTEDCSPSDSIRIRFESAKKMSNKATNLGIPIKAYDPEHKLTSVLLNIGIDDIFNMNEVEQSLEAMLFVNLTWTDPRLEVKCFGEHFEISDAEIGIWKPKINIGLLRESSVINSPESLAQIIVRPSEGGIVHWLSELVVKMSCQMNFQTFPFDVVVCKILINKLQNNFVIQWGNVEIGNWDTFQSHKIDSIVTANLFWKAKVYPMCFIRMRRYLTYYILQGFIPNILIVMVAWVSFFVDPSIAPARVSLGVSSLVALVLQYGNIMRSIPKVGYIKMIDLWTLMCILFIVYSILEFAYICLLRRGDEKCPAVERKCKRIDGLSRVLYPVALLLLSILYVAVSIGLAPKDDMKLSQNLHDYREHSIEKIQYL